MVIYYFNENIKTIEKSGKGFSIQTCEEGVWGEDQDAARPCATGIPLESWLSVLEILIELGDRPIASLPQRDLGDFTEFLLCLSVVSGRQKIEVEKILKLNLT